MTKPLVAIIMGSQSDWPVLSHAADMLKELNIPFDAEIVSAHRTPDKLYDYVSGAADRGIEVIIAGAGGAAHLPGMAAAKTRLPVLGVPMPTHTLNGIDSLLSIVQMPAGIPVGTLAIGKAGAINSALLAAAILGLKYPEIAKALEQFRQKQTDNVLNNAKPGEQIA
jgi:5-(carboxyamino)imidazole ribonucleotide mutase